MRNKKGEATIRNLLIGIVLVSMIVGFVVAFMADLNQNYSPTGFNTTQIEQFDRLTDVTNITNQVQNETFSIRDQGTLDALTSIAQGVITAVKLTVVSFDVINILTNDAAASIGIPRYITGGIIVILLIVIIFIVLRAIMKWDKV